MDMPNINAKTNQINVLVLYGKRIASFIDGKNQFNPPNSFIRGKEKSNNANTVVFSPKKI